MIATVIIGAASVAFAGALAFALAGSILRAWRDNGGFHEQRQ